MQEKWRYNENAKTANQPSTESSFYTFKSFPFCCKGSKRKEQKVLGENVQFQAREVKKSFGQNYEKIFEVLLI